MEGFAEAFAEAFAGPGKAAGALGGNGSPARPSDGFQTYSPEVNGAKGLCRWWTIVRWGRCIGVERDRRSRIGWREIREQEGPSLVVEAM